MRDRLPQLLFGNGANGLLPPFGADANQRRSEPHAAAAAAASVAARSVPIRILTDVRSRRSDDAHDMRNGFSRRPPLAPVERPRTPSPAFRRSPSPSGSSNYEQRLASGGDAARKMQHVSRL